MAKLVLSATLAVALSACGDDAPTDSGSDGGATSLPGNEPSNDDGGGMNDEPDTGGEEQPGEDTTGGTSPEGGTTGDPE